MFSNPIGQIKNIGNDIADEAVEIWGAFTMLPNAMLSGSLSLVGQDDGCQVAEMTKKAGLLVGMSQSATMAAAMIEAWCLWNKYVKHMQNNRSEATAELLTELAMLVERHFGVPIINHNSVDRVHKRRVQPSIDRGFAALDQFGADRMQIMEYINTQNMMLRYDTMATKVVDPMTGESVPLDEMQRRMILRGEDIDVPADQVVVSSDDADRPAIDPPEPVEENFPVALGDTTDTTVDTAKAPPLAKPPRSKSVIAALPVVPMGIAAALLWILIM